MDYWIGLITGLVLGAPLGISAYLYGKARLDFENARRSPPPRRR